MTPAEIQAECEAIADLIGTGAYVHVAYVVDRARDCDRWDAGASRFVPGCEAVAQTYHHETPRKALAVLSDLVAAKVASLEPAGA